MKKLIILCLLLTGCATATYKETRPDGTLIELRTTRWGQRDLTGFGYKSDMFGSEFIIKNQSSEAGQFKEIIESVDGVVMKP
jgi:hypothetical protein